MSAVERMNVEQIIERLVRIESTVKHVSQALDAVLPIVEQNPGPDPGSLTGNKKALYEAADESTPLNAKKLCGKSKLGYSSHTRGLLADLVHHGLLKKNRGGGYLRVPADKSPDKVIVPRTTSAATLTKGSPKGLAGSKDRVGEGDGGGTMINTQPPCEKCGTPATRVYDIRPPGTGSPSS